ncbi:DUF305 domain-containing protein [Aquipuribacter hungaricus]|uniref:DUF305 domain-containing protein n=1 Tax=Aquipuribacter hungaricus TaxID=545624 RepID=A0ABV7WIL4_9MICO
MTTAPRRAGALFAALGTTFVLAACGADAGGAGGSAAPSGAPPTAVAEVSSEHAEADVAFAQGMLPHHRQAVEMSALAGGRAEDPEVVALADEISAAQKPEIVTLTAMLEAWGAEEPAAGGGGHEGMAGMEGGAAGMMTEDDMSALEAAEGAEFDRLFLELMVAHHEGAVEMAQTELDEGENPEALGLAEQVVDTQQAEIERMRSLLGR